MILQPALSTGASAWHVDWPRLMRRSAMVAVLVWGVAAIYANARGRAYGLDFNGMWRAGHRLLAGNSPYVAPDWQRLLLESNAFITPPPLAVLSAPFSLLPFGLAIALWNLLSAGAFVAALRLVGVNDWRVFLVAACSLPFVFSLILGQPDGLFALGAAVAWRYRESGRGAFAVGALIAAKLLAWPLVIWLLVTRRVRCSFIALAAAAGLLIGSWALIGFHGLLDYPRLLAADARAFETRSHSIVAAAMNLGVSASLARGLAIGCAAVVGLAVVRLARRSDLGWFTAAIAVGLLSSPVLWTHYLVLLLVPLAIGRPRFDRLWLLTVVFWLSPVEPAHGWQIVLVLLIVVAVTILAARPPWRRVQQAANPPCSPRSEARRTAPLPGAASTR